MDHGCSEVHNKPRPVGPPAARQGNAPDASTTIIRMHVGKDSKREYKAQRYLESLRTGKAKLIISSCPRFPSSTPDKHGAGYRLTPGVQHDRVQEMARSSDHARQNTGKVGTIDQFRSMARRGGRRKGKQYLHPVSNRHQVGRHKRDSQHDDPRNDPDRPEPLPHRRPLLEKVR